MSLARDGNRLMNSPSIKRHHASQVLALATRGHRAKDIATSWQRCLEVYRLDPERKEPIHILTSLELREARDPLDYLLSIAEQPLMELSRQVAAAGYIVMLTDATGVVLNTKAAGDTTPFGRWGLATGAIWSEQNEGTNGVGVCLAERRPITVHREEHFRSSYVGLTCSVTPIFDPVGRLIGGLDISSGDSRIDELVIAFAQAATNQTAARLESELFRHTYKNCWIASIAESPEGCALIAFNKDRQLVGANRLARTLLGLDDDRIQRGIEIVEAGFRDFPLNAQQQLVEVDGSSALVIDRSAQIEFPRSRPRPGALEPAPSDLVALAGGGAQTSDSIRRVVSSVRQGIPALIFGETGTGKERFARALHAYLAAPGEPFIRFDCEAFAGTMRNCENDKCDDFEERVRAAESGTLFLDCLGALPSSAQTRLLDFLLEERPLQVDKCKGRPARIISASRADIEDKVRNGSFRSDLYYILRGATLELPPLRSRHEKPALIKRLLQEVDPQLHLSDDALQLLMNYTWPGNIRELGLVLHVAAASCSNQIITARDIDVVAVKHENADAPGEGQPGSTIAAAERSVVLKQLENNNFDIAKTAAALGMSRATLYRRMKRYNVTKVIVARPSIEKF